MAHGSGLKQPSLPRYPDPTAFDGTWGGALILELEKRDAEVNQGLAIYELSGNFAIDSTGLKTVTIDYVFPERIAVDVTHCQISVVENTAVDDWAYNLLKVSSISQTQVVGKINVSTASATGSATATMVIWVRP